MPLSLPVSVCVCHKQRRSLSPPFPLMCAALTQAQHSSRRGPGCQPVLVPAPPALHFPSSLLSFFCAFFLAANEPWGEKQVT